jgi:hypothetical protein
MVSEGLITEMQKGEIVSYAAQSEFGHKKYNDAFKEKRSLVQVLWLVFS